MIPLFRGLCGVDKGRIFASTTTGQSGADEGVSMKRLIQMFRSSLNANKENEEAMSALELEFKRPNPSRSRLQNQNLF